MGAERHDRLKEARLAAGFASAAEATRRFGWSSSAYRHHENGTRSFSYEQAIRYGKAYKVNPAWLAGLDGRKDDQAGLNYLSYLVSDPVAKIDTDLKSAMEQELNLLVIPEIDLQKVVTHSEFGRDFAQAVTGRVYAFPNAMFKSVQDKSKLVAIVGSDNTMAPMFGLDDLAIVDAGYEEILYSDGIWAFLYDDVAMVRHVRTSKSQLYLKATKGFVGELQVDADDLTIIGHIVWTGGNRNRA